MVKRSRRRPLTAESRVRFPLAVPQQQNCYLIISKLAQILPLHALVLTIRILLMTFINGEWRDLRMAEMVINKIWTSGWDIHIREMLIFITFLKLNFF